MDNFDDDICQLPVLCCWYCSVKVEAMVCYTARGKPCGINVCWGHADYAELRAGEMADVPGSVELIPMDQVTR
jgi:hypothetical protein